ncbi:MAG TPA: hypothetical protein VF087_08415 [Solirubrobacteraceae bacterium]
MLAPSLTFVVLGSLQDGVAVWSRLAELPGYLSDTFLHLSLGDAPPVFQESLHDLVLDGLPVDVALLASPSARTRCAGCSRCGCRGSCSPRRWTRCATA